MGIDLGTTFSAVACLGADGRPRIIANEYGRPITPSVVCFDGGRIAVGDEARERQANGATEIAAFFKRAMGDPYFSLEFGGQSYTAPQLSALVLRHLKELATKDLGEPVTAAVITVPAYFTNLQREATIEAGGLAGLEVLSIISEPTAAALAYGLRPGRAGETILVYDLGGGTFDVSLVRISDTELRVIGTDGDHSLGGKDWDDRLVSELAQRFNAEFRTELVGENYDDLLVRAEALKRSLSVREVVEISLQAGGHTARYQVTRAQFENLTGDLLERTRRLTERVLEEAGLGWDQISGVVPVGGSTRLPMVRALLAEISGRPSLAGVQPDEAVALGAAIQAALDLEAAQPTGPRFFLPSRRAVVDVMSHSLGMIATNRDNNRYVNSILIRRNQPIPSLETRPYRLRVSRRHQNRLEVFLTQAESDDPLQCVYLGKYVFSDIPVGSAPSCDIDVTYAYAQGGVVKVSAKERASGHELSLSVEPLPDDVPARFAGSPAADRARDRVAVYLVFDVSGSMGGSPLVEAKKAAHAFIAECDPAMMTIGIMAVANEVRVLLAASENVMEIEHAIDRLEVGLGYGNSAHPFDEVHRLLEPLPGPRYAVVLADGVWEQQMHAVKRAQRCHAAGIEIIAVGFGGADQKFLRQISSSDQSVFTDLGHLSETFSSIAQELADLGGSTGAGRLTVHG